MAKLPIVVLSVDPRMISRPVWRAVSLIEQRILAAAANDEQAFELFSRDPGDRG